MVAWFGGTKEGTDDVGILYARRVDGMWTTPVMLERTHNEAHWNPVLFRMPNGKIYLFYKVGRTISSWRTFYRISENEGETFGGELELVKGDIGGRGPVKNKPILLSDGTVLAPASYEPDKNIEAEQQDWKCFVDHTSDNGKTWTRTDFVSKPDELSVIQPTLWESEAGAVHMMTRSNGKRIYRSDSKDYGKTWCKLYPTELPNNNSGIDCVQISSGVLALVYNPVTGTWGARTPLQVICSKDNGKSWGDPLILQDGLGEFSYPSVIYDRGRLCICYTDNRQTICYCEVML